VALGHRWPWLILGLGGTLETGRREQVVHRLFDIVSHREQDKSPATAEYDDRWREEFCHEPKTPIAKSDDLLARV